MVDKRKIFVGGLSYETSEDALKEVLQAYGPLTSIRIVTDYSSGKSKGFGFASFENETDAADAIESLDNTTLDGRRIGVKESLK